MVDMIERAEFYFVQVDAISEQKLQTHGMYRLHWLRDIDDPDTLFVPEQVELIEIGVNKAALVVEIFENLFP